MKTINGFTFEESVLNLNNFSPKTIKRLRSFFSEDKIQSLVEDNKWEDIILEWIYFTNDDNISSLIDFLVLSEINFLPYMKKIPVYSFYCSPIKSITIPNNIKKIEPYAFSHSSINSIDFEGTKKEWYRVTKLVDWKQENIYSPILLQCSDGYVRIRVY